MADPTTGSGGGALDLNACPTRDQRGRCRVTGELRCYRAQEPCRCCEFCVRCGGRKHVSLHGPVYRFPPGSEPFDHEFIPREDGKAGRRRVVR